MFALRFLKHLREAVLMGNEVFLLRNKKSKTSDLVNSVTLVRWFS